MNSKKILIADDHSLIRDGIAKLLINDPNYFIVATAANGLELIQKYFYYKPDIILTDISMPKLSGIDALKRIREFDSDVKAFFISMYLSEENIYLIYSIGGKGLVDKTISEGELRLALKRICDGGHFFGYGMSTEELLKIVKKYQGNKYSQKIEAHGYTEREVDIMLLLGDGCTIEEISAELNISKRTVETYRNRLCMKLNLKNTPQLIKYAVENKFDIELIKKIISNSTS
ncbi:MAG: response regulator transcription factor [Melioribacteraceae bacterium]|nr:response regulator transcription factor [Melioribacteraceae bacterium]MCF8352966.1 response regulator transcription factor [Melioribacteraceae bacterium]MCF8395349.1 response regulator transcription factor [Melioribacteraceae bacterium]MCF8417849.1 response regulator transcription factor [Melioribacteraceae bacterium]